MNDLRTLLRVQLLSWGLVLLPGARALDSSNPLALAGVTVTPHVRAANLRYRREPAPDLAARVQMFLHNDAAQVVALRSDAAVRFNGKTPQQLLEDRHWAWHDTPSAWPGQDLELLPGAMTVWTFNGKSGEWGGPTTSRSRFLVQPRARLRRSW